MTDRHSIDLCGHSGCLIQLIEKNKRFFVRKTAGSAAYNERLIAQANKQSTFQMGVIKAPKVLNQGYTKNGLFYFDMEYIAGITLSEYIQTIEIGKLKYLVDIIVTNMIPDAKNNTNAQQIFQQKIISLRMTLKKQNNSVINEALDILQNHDWSVFPQTICHGDLTLENVIVKDNQLYLIDFLDSFYNCWILDMGTLLQDVQTLWSYREYKQLDINTTIRLIIFRDLLLDAVKNKVGNQYREVYYALLLKLIRIYPYTQDEKTYQFLTEKTKSIIDIIKEEKFYK